MARHRKRQANGTPWHRKFDDCWYATIDGKRTKLRNEAGLPIKGKDHRQQAELAVARVKLQIEPVAAPGDVLVATVVSAYHIWVIWKNQRPLSTTSWLHAR